MRIEDMPVRLSDEGAERFRRETFALVSSHRGTEVDRDSLQELLEAETGNADERSPLSRFLNQGQEVYAWLSKDGNKRGKALARLAGLTVQELRSRLLAAYSGLGLPWTAELVRGLELRGEYRPGPYAEWRPWGSFDQLQELANEAENDRWKTDGTRSPVSSRRSPFRKPSPLAASLYELHSGVVSTGDVLPFLPTRAALESWFKHLHSTEKIGEGELRRLLDARGTASLGNLLDADELVLAVRDFLDRKIVSFEQEELERRREGWALEASRRASSPETAEWWETAALGLLTSWVWKTGSLERSLPEDLVGVFLEHGNSPVPVPQLIAEDILVRDEEAASRLALCNGLKRYGRVRLPRTLSAEDFRASVLPLDGFLLSETLGLTEDLGGWLAALDARASFAIEPLNEHLSALKGVFRRPDEELANSMDAVEALWLRILTMVMEEEPEVMSLLEPETCAILEAASARLAELGVATSLAAPFDTGVAHAGVELSRQGQEVLALLAPYQTSLDWQNHDALARRPWKDIDRLYRHRANVGDVTARQALIDPNLEAGPFGPSLTQPPLRDRLRWGVASYDDLSGSARRAIAEEAVQALSDPSLRTETIALLKKLLSASNRHELPPRIFKTVQAVELLASGQTADAIQSWFRVFPSAKGDETADDELLVLLAALEDRSDALERLATLDSDDITPDFPTAHWSDDGLRFPELERLARIRESALLALCEAYPNTSLSPARVVERPWEVTNNCICAATQDRLALTRFLSNLSGDEFADDAKWADFLRSELGLDPKALGMLPTEVDEPFWLYAVLPENRGSALKQFSERLFTYRYYNSASPFWVRVREQLRPGDEALGRWTVPNELQRELEIIAIRRSDEALRAWCERECLTEGGADPSNEAMNLLFRNLESLGDRAWRFLSAECRYRLIDRLTELPERSVWFGRTRTLRLRQRYTLMKRHGHRGEAIAAAALMVCELGDPCRRLEQWREFMYGDRTGWGYDGIHTDVDHLLGWLGEHLPDEPAMPGARRKAEGEDAADHPSTTSPDQLDDRILLAWEVLTLGTTWLAKELKDEGVELGDRLEKILIHFVSLRKQPATPPTNESIVPGLRGLSTILDNYFTSARAEVVTQRARPYTDIELPVDLRKARDAMAGGNGVPKHPRLFSGTETSQLTLPGDVESTTELVNHLHQYLFVAGAPPMRWVDAQLAKQRVLTHDELREVVRALVRTGVNPEDVERTWRKYFPASQ